MKAATSLLRSIKLAAWSVTAALLLALGAGVCSAATIAVSALARGTVGSTNDLIPLDNTNSGAGTFTLVGVKSQDLLSGVFGLVPGFVIKSPTLTGTTVASNLQAIPNVLGYRQIVTPQLWGAVGNNVHDDTTAFQNALYFAGTSNGVPYELHVPAGHYKLTSGLVLPACNDLHIIGDGSAHGDDVILDFNTAAASANGITFSSLVGASGFLNGLHIEGITILGQTNSATGFGIFLGDPGYTTNAGGGPIGRYSFIRNVNVSGFANGIGLYDWETCTLDHVGAYYNTNIDVWLVRADSCALRDCQIGWGLLTNGAPSTTTALWNQGGGLGVHVFGGEWGNCLRRLYQDGGVTCWYGGNLESVTVESCHFTNTCRYLEFGCRNNSGYAVPCWNVFCNPGGQNNYGIQIYGSSCEGSFNHRLLVQGNSLSPPHIEASSFIAAPAIELASTIGGAVTTTYDDATSMVDKNFVNNWDAQQNFKGPGGVGNGPALRIQDGLTYGDLEVGADLGAQTVTANNAKEFTLAGPRYANNVSAVYQVGILQFDAVAADDIARWGTGSGLFGCTRHQFWTASSEGAVAAQHWEIGTAGNFTAASTENVVAANGYVIATNFQGSGTSPSGIAGGGLTNLVLAPAGDYTLTNANVYVKMAAAHSLTLPGASTNAGSWVWCIETGNGTNAILTVSGQSINGGTKWTNAVQYAETFLWCDGTQWWAH